MEYVAEIHGESCLNNMINIREELIDWLVNFIGLIIILTIVFPELSFLKVIILVFTLNFVIKLKVKYILKKIR